MRPGVEDMSGAGIGNPHQRIVRRSLVLVSERIRLGQSIELGSGDFVRRAACDTRRCRRDGRRPACLLGSSRVVYLAATHKNLTCGQ